MLSLPLYTVCSGADSLFTIQVVKNETNPDLLSLLSLPKAGLVTILVSTRSDESGELTAVNRTFLTASLFKVSTTVYDVRIWNCGWILNFTTCVGRDPRFVGFEKQMANVNLCLAAIGNVNLFLRWSNTSRGEILFIAV